MQKQTTQVKLHVSRSWLSRKITSRIVTAIAMFLAGSLALNGEAQKEDLFCVSARTLPWLRSHRSIEKAASMQLEKSLVFLEFRAKVLAVEDLYDVAWNADNRSDLFRMATEMDADLATKVLYIKLREAEQLGEIGFAGACYGWIRRQSGLLPQLESDFKTLTSSREFYKQTRQGESGDVINAIWVRIMRDVEITRGDEDALNWVRETQQVVETWPSDSYEIGTVLKFFSVERPATTIASFLKTRQKDVTVSDLMISAAFIYHYPDEATLFFSDPKLREKFRDVARYDKSPAVSQMFAQEKGSGESD